MRVSHLALRVADTDVAIDRITQIAGDTGGYIISSRVWYQAWLDVEKAPDGNTEIPNRTLLVDAGSSGVMVTSDTVANWRDPLVAHSYPVDHATEVPINPEVTITWNQSMAADTTFSVMKLTQPVPGSFTYDPSTWTVTFTPSMYLEVDTTYTINAAYQTDIVGDPQLLQSSSTFTTIEHITIHTIALPIVRRN